MTALNNTPQTMSGLITPNDAQKLNNIIHPAVEVVTPGAVTAAPTPTPTQPETTVTHPTKHTTTRTVKQTVTVKRHGVTVHATRVTTYHYKNGRGTGDCWTNSAILYGQLTSQGQKARIIQYSTSLSPRHRSVQVYSNGGWVNYDYKGNGYAQTYYATGNSVNGKVVT